MDSRYAAWAARWRVPLAFLFGVAYLVFSRPAVLLLIAGGGVALAGLALRAIAAGHLEKDSSLASSGPYAYTRNPLYLGSFLLGMGFALAGGSWVLGLAFLLLFSLVYWPVMRREEENLRRHFGEAYEHYAAQVPIFLPRGRSRRAGSSSEKFRWERYRKNREYEAALGFVVGMVFLVLKLKLA